VPDNLKAALSESLDEAQWDWLMPHAKRDALVLVDPQLDLLDVGVAIARDDTQQVQSWIGSQQLYKPSSEQLATWNTQPETPFRALIVQPYVLVQELPMSAA